MCRVPGFWCQFFEVFPFEFIDRNGVHCRRPGYHHMTGYTPVKIVFKAMKLAECPARHPQVHHTMRSMVRLMAEPRKRLAGQKMTGIPR